MKRQAVVIGTVIMLTLVAMAWYLGWQLQEAQLARVASFASYYQVLNGYLQTTNKALQSYRQTNSPQTLHEAVSDMQTVERMAAPLLGLAPKSMSSLWSDFLDHDWKAVTQSLGLLVTQGEYFSTAGLPEDDRLFLLAISQQMARLAELMDAPAISLGVAPGVRIRLDQLLEMDRLVEDLVTTADCYVKNGMLPSRLPKPQLSWQEAEPIAREALQLTDVEWKLVGGEKQVSELRQGRDYYSLQFEPTSDYSGNMKSAAVGVDRQTGQIVRLEWGAPLAEEAQLSLPVADLEQLALQATLDLPGEKAVLATANDKAGHPTAVVVPVIKGIPMLIDSVQLTFQAQTGAILKWENYSWGSTVKSVVPRLSTASARDRLVAQIDWELEQVEECGLTVVLSPYSHQATLVYCFSSLTVDEQGGEQENHYFVNARTGKLERVGFGW